MSQSFIGDGMVVGWTEVVSSNSAHVKWIDPLHIPELILNRRFMQFYLKFYIND
jgi:class 3 adenylate cyclase